VVRPSERRALAIRARQYYAVSIRVACAIVGVSESCYRYKPKPTMENALVADWLLRLTEANKRWDFGKCFLYLRDVEGFNWSYQRVYRIYQELELESRTMPRG